MIEPDRKSWGTSAHERKVENLYAGGVENYIDWHNGYLNFGLWEDGISDYVKAAENLVHRMGKLLGLNEASWWRKWKQPLASGASNPAR